MKTTLTALAAAFALAVSLAGVAKPALAGDQHGDFMIRGLVTGVLPDSSATVFAGGSRIPGADAEASDEVIPAMTLTYFFTDNIAVELFCCFSKHEIDAAGSIAGLGELGDTWIFPPALTAQYHFNPNGTFKPYVGAGLQYIAFFDEGTGQNKLGAADLSIDDGLGFTLQAGLDISVGNGWYLNADVKKTWLDTSAKWNGTPVRADVDLDPLIVSAGFGYRFNLSDLLGGHGTTTAYDDLK
ncbi:MAG: OmpW family protein [Methyloceanibacter sp.]|uniref:OmpW/AlkL family protein n=1 Tax=Methyloceanibacter sp. TaxID=1965321 RepID=UPI001D89318F|nr:OmpW family outer membrane protein [Methyloceanibacter sp.]MCB1443289.1 OmpW family protein [Methyloceanibacter sp.]MCC0058194.1 OmpW family protein [Hyphomicrobiaceae bacterium]